MDLHSFRLLFLPVSLKNVCNNRLRKAFIKFIMQTEEEEGRKNGELFPTSMKRPKHNEFQCLVNV